MAKNQNQTAAKELRGRAAAELQSLLASKGEELHKAQMKHALGQLRAIRDQEEGRAQRTLAVAMTGFAGRQDHELALRAGFDDHVAKPVDPYVLIERMRALAASLRAAAGGAA